MFIEFVLYEAHTMRGSVDFVVFVDTVTDSAIDSTFDLICYKCCLGCDEDSAVPIFSVLPENIVG